MSAGQWQEVGTPPREPCSQHTQQWRQYTQDQNRQRLEETPLAQRLGAMKAVLNESQPQRAKGHESRLDILAAFPDSRKPASQLALHKASKATASPAQAQSPVLSPILPSPAQDRPAAKQTRRLVPCLPIIGVAGSGESKAMASDCISTKEARGCRLPQASQETGPSFHSCEPRAADWCKGKELSGPHENQT